MYQTLSGNAAAEVTRTVTVVDTTVPVITLLGEDPVTIEVGDYLHRCWRYCHR